MPSKLASARCSISQRSGDVGILAPANFHLGQAFFHLGDHHRAAEFHSSNIQALDGKLARERLGMAGIPLVFSRGHLSWSLAELGRFAEGVAEWQEAMKLAGEVKHPFSEAFARYCGGFLYIRKGEIERAITHLEPGLAMCRSMNNRLDLPFVASFLGLAYAFEGRPADGVPLLEEAVQEATTLKLRSGQSWLLGMLAYAYMFADRLQEADELAQRAIGLAQEHSERSWLAWAQYFLGQIGLPTGAPIWTRRARHSRAAWRKPAIWGCGRWLRASSWVWGSCIGAPVKMTLHTPI